jgi:hypothetical protein
LAINQTEESLFFESIFKYPELAFFQYKFDSVSNCDENSGYEDYLRIPVFVNKEDYQFPLKICIVRQDLTGNKSLPKEFIVKRSLL